MSSQRLKSILGVVACLLMVFLSMTTAYAKVYDDTSYRYAAPGCALGLPYNANNWNGNHGFGSGALGAVFYKSYTGALSTTGFVSGTEMTGATANCGTGALYYTFNVPSGLAVNDTFSFIVPIKCQNISYYTWTAGLVDSTGFTATYEYTSTVTERSYLGYFPAGYSTSSDNDGNYYCYLPSSVCDQYATINVTVTTATTETTRLTMYISASSPTDEQGDYSGLLDMVDDSLSNPGVAAVGEKITDISAISWVAVLLAVNVTLILAALLINFLLSL